MQSCGKVVLNNGGRCFTVVVN